MAVGDYLHKAAAELQGAAEALREEAREMRADASRFENKTNNEIQSKTTERRLRAVAMQGSDEPSERQHLAAQVHGLKNEIEAKKREVSNKKSEISSEIKEKESKAAELQSEAHSLRMKASSM